MSGHLGPRVSDLVDGRLSSSEADRCWSHVHTCHLCRDQVEREGWVKTQLAGWSFEAETAPSDLKGMLRGMPPAGAGQVALGAMPPGEMLLHLAQHGGPRPSRFKLVGLAALGSGAAGAAVLGVLALGTAPAEAPTIDRRAPLNAPVNSVPTPSPTTARIPAKLPAVPLR